MLTLNFQSLPFSSNQTVSWIYIGDTHLTRSGEQNEIDLGKIVDEINDVYASDGIDFVFIPGDIADDGSTVAYKAFWKYINRLQLPWRAIVGDHNVHEKSFANFHQYVSPELYSGFNVQAVVWCVSFPASAASQTGGHVIKVPCLKRECHLH